MTGRLSSCWVGVSTRAGLLERTRAAGGASASVFEGDPRAVEILPADTRRPAQAAVQRCLQMLDPLIGESYSAVELLLVFAGSFATAWAHRLVVAVDDETARVRPTDSTNMETSESIRAALAALDRGRPRSALVVASAFDPALVASLCAGCRSVLVVRIELHGSQPEECDVLAAHVRSEGAGP